VTKAEVNETGKEVAKNSLKVWAGRMFFLARKFTPAGLVSSVAMGAAIEVPAVSGLENSPTWWTRNCRQEFEERTNTQSKTLISVVHPRHGDGHLPALLFWPLVPWLTWLSATFMPCLPVDGLRHLHVPLLILMRHGQSMWNAAGLFTGWVDVPLTLAKGIDEAREGGRCHRSPSH